MQLRAVFLITILYTTIKTICIFSKENVGERVISSNHKFKYEKTLQFKNFTNVFWFVQITDLHFSKHINHDIYQGLIKFLTVHLPIIKPDLVIVTGDLTDARTRLPFGSMQNVEEWKLYQKALNNSRILNLTKWIDMRGNHDMFDVAGKGNDKDYFKFYAVCNSSNNTTMKIDINKSFGQYSFITIDASPSPGPKWPFNLFGFLTPQDTRMLTEVVKDLEKKNHTFWFGHYPLSAIVTDHFDLHSLIGRTGFAYFSGHFHTLGGLLPQMHALHPENFWEFELGDWRDNRYFRIVAIDHDLVSFVDLQTTSAKRRQLEWPIVLITNPKNSDFLLPGKEPIGRILQSTHIRILVWSNSPITSVSVKINNVSLGNATKAEECDMCPLYILPWKPSDFNNNQTKVHTLEVTVKDANGSSRNVTQKFTFDAEIQYRGSVFARMVLLLQHTVNIQICFFIIWFTCLGLLMIPRLLPRSLRHSMLRRRSLRRLYHISMENRAFYPLVMYLLYEMTCPISMGYVLSEHFGLFFTYGIYVSNSYVPEMLLYIYEFVQLIILSIFFIPYAVTFVVRPSGSRVDRLMATNKIMKSPNEMNKLDELVYHQFKAAMSTRSLVLFISAILFTIAQMIFCITKLWIPYGLTAVILSPGRIIPLILVWSLYFQSSAYKVTKQI